MTTQLQRLSLLYVGKQTHDALFVKRSFTLLGNLNFTDCVCEPFASDHQITLQSVFLLKAQFELILLFVRFKFELFA